MLQLSPTTAQLFTALAKFQGDVPNLLKTDTVKVTMKAGGTYNFKYAPLDVAIETVQPILAKYGLSVTQPLVGYGKLYTIIAHESGEFMSAELDFSTALQKEDYNTKAMKPMLSSQDIGGVITYFRRYAFVSMLRLAADEDDDANSSLGNKVEKEVKYPKAPPKPEQEAPAPDAPTEPKPKFTKGVKAKAEPVVETAPEPVAPPVAKPAGDDSFMDELNAITDKNSIMNWYNNKLKDAKGDEKKALLVYRQSVTDRYKSM